MDVSLGCIVEGKGEVSAVRILLRRVAAGIDPSISVRPVIAMHARSALLRGGELERAVQALSYRLTRNSGMLILLDSDDEQACVLGPALLRRANSARPDVRIRVVLATREYEAWFLAAAESLAGKSGLRSDFTPPADPEKIRGAKEYLARNMKSGGTYSPTRHQPALTEQFDLAAARSAKSFQKFCRDLQSLLAEISSDPHC
ncbi:MAG TPA: DUF4276 family protein [Bryobacteraceae bacterium]|nr:DUF4276 family protein [Bryobacteraceae bacterium]